MPAPMGHAPYNVNGEGGRPPKFNENDINNFADELLEWIKNPSNFWLKDFCIDRGINPDRMSDWAKENERFRGSYELAMHSQESKIFKGSMLDVYNVTMAKLALTNWHKWKEKTEQTLSGDPENPLTPYLVKANGKSKNLVDDDSAS